MIRVSGHLPKQHSSIKQRRRNRGENKKLNNKKLNKGKREEESRKKC